jgi:hypothetical protein
MGPAAGLPALHSLARISFMKPVSTLLAVVTLSAVAGAQVPPPPPRVPAPPAKPVKPEDIKGEVTGPTLSVKVGQVVAAGDQLVIEFEYKTDAPGKTAVAPEIIVGGRPHPGFGHQPFTMTEKAGKGQVKVSYLNWGAKTPDLTVDEIKLFLWPSSGAPGRRDVATIKGPVKFEGEQIFTTTDRAKLAALEKEVAELRLAVERLEKKLAEKGK